MPAIPVDVELGTQASRPVHSQNKETQIDTDRRFAPDADWRSWLLCHPTLLAPEPFEKGNGLGTL